MLGDLPVGKFEYQATRIYEKRRRSSTACSAQGRKLPNAREELRAQYRVPKRSVRSVRAVPGADGHFFERERGSRPGVCRLRPAERHATAGGRAVARGRAVAGQTMRRSRRTVRGPVGRLLGHGRRRQRSRPIRKERSPRHHADSQHQRHGRGDGRDRSGFRGEHRRPSRFTGRVFTGRVLPSRPGRARPVKTRPVKTRPAKREGLRCSPRKPERSLPSPRP